MKILRAILILFFLTTCSHAFAQSLKIISVRSPDDHNNAGKILAKQMVGKKLDLAFYKDSVTVSVPPLHQKEKLKQIAADQYFRSDSTELAKTSSSLIIYRTDGQLSSVNLKMIHVDQQAGDKTEVWIVAKVE